MPKGRNPEEVYSKDLAEALRNLKSDISLLSDLQPYVAFYVDNAEMNSFVNGTYFGHIMQQTFYVYVYRVIMVVCKVLDPTAPDSWTFLRCYRELGPNTPALRELALYYSRHAAGSWSVSPEGDAALNRWMRREAVGRAREAFASTKKRADELQGAFDTIVSLPAYKRVRLFRNEKIAHALSELDSRERKRFSASGPVANPEIRCVLEVSDAVIDFAEDFFGHLTGTWPGFRDRQKVTKEYYNDYFQRLGFAGRMEIKWSE